MNSTFRHFSFVHQSTYFIAVKFFTIFINNLYMLLYRILFKMLPPFKIPINTTRGDS